jgi:beta-carotene 3-hydroxylase
MTDVVVGVMAFVVMEPVTYATHRWVMHGIGRVLHNSHHRDRPGRFEANDLFPVIFASVTIVAMALGTASPSLHVLVAAGSGVTAYGAAYMFVHDVYIHGRLGRLPALRGFEHLRRSHAVHHLYSNEPYGMLVPIVPARLRARAAHSSRVLKAHPR